MNERVWKDAIVFIHNKLGGAGRAEIRYKMKRSRSWYMPYHFTWGMTVRNLLRENGFGEREMGVENLDDFYIGIGEKAAER